MTAEKKHIVLEATELSVGYFSKKKSFPVAEHINFSIHEGELIGLVGANGVGKSTLLRSLVGMQPTLSGKVEINGKHLSAISSLELATQLSVVLTEVPASKNLTVQELVTLGRQPYTNWMGSLTETDKKQIRYALKITDTEKLAHKKCFELSDGQLQRVAIARALAQDTPLIVLDEPTTHLDLYHRAYILKLLRQLTTETGKTILFSTHEIDLAIQLSDTMLIMNETSLACDQPCKLIEKGSFDALFPKETIAFDKTTGRFSIKK
ncbi:ABC transporter ATP-binding protein [Marinirhabdus gelatinilytica]|uniref:Iron complex transport system ATP-binding protein n=1 Tax=Marinirhabdus gelatinilytica TaxID=1703343 RepID=A0A370QFP0_9FLAO|nr:ABC transporter ATP-binding protein [Marinirhabdus gelatinilytica]RDK87184.1 iron complex transport system ATP-binding protein [Marinirhabdus gelatinilytica]